MADGRAMRTSYRLISRPAVPRWLAAEFGSPNDPASARCARDFNSRFTVLGENEKNERDSVSYLQIARHV